MSAHMPSNTPLEDEKALRGALIKHFSLAPATVDRLYAAMQSNDLGFEENAVRMGYITREDLAEARAMLGTQTAQDPSFIEVAMRRVSSDRRLVVTHGENVHPGKRLILAHDPYNPRSERIRALRTELLLLNEGSRGANVVPVLSPCPVEGRSQLAAELALSFAQLGRRTLLVDADFRKPSQHTLFGTDNDKGLTRSIGTGERPYFHPVVGTQAMHLLTSGPIPPNPLEMLSDGRFQRLFTEWRNSYEFIVLDTPPVTEYADGLAVATLAVRALLLSRAQHTPYKSMRDMLRRLEPTQSQILGAVLNHF
jgi:receptor protein-tyrosine kinase